MPADDSHEISRLIFRKIKKDFTQKNVVCCSPAWCLKAYSKTPPIDILSDLNHLTDWAQTCVMSFSRQFDFHDVIYHIGHCNVDKRGCNIVFTTT